MSPEISAQPRGVEVRLLRRVPADPARLRGRTADAGRAGADRRLRRGVQRDGRRSVRRVPGRGVDHHAHDEQRIREIREQSGVLVTIGACATAGGIQALRNFADVDEFASVVYARPEYIETLATSTPASAHVTVDYELRGCPIDRGSCSTLWPRCWSAANRGCRPPRCAPSASGRGVTCVTVADGIACLGPVTHAGCGALCPRHHRGCYGCFGPTATPNMRRDDPAAAPRRHVRRRRRPGLRHLQRHRSSPPSGSGADDEQTDGTLRVGALTRVEGEGALHVELRDGVPETVELNIYEPPRFFEAFLRGRAYTEPPDITARICGICPVAYQTSACNAIEDACGVTLDRRTRRAAPAAVLRRVDPQPHPAHLHAARPGLPRRART